MAPATDLGLATFIFSGIAVAAAVFAVILDRLRAATLFLWICGMAMGGVFLTFGAEYLAVVQWVLSTVTAVSLGFYSVLFGEEKKPERPWGWLTLSVLAGIGFILVAGYGLRDMPGLFAAESGVISLSVVGKSLISDNFLALKGLVVTLLVVTVGAGVLARPEAEE